MKILLIVIVILIIGLLLYKKCGKGKGTCGTEKKE